MASSTTTRKPANADRDALAAGHSERMHGDHARQAPENRPTADNPTGAAGVTFTFGAAVVSAGLVAGLFFFNSSVVMPALAELDDRTFVEVLDKINDAVYNPLFFAVTFGAPVLIAVAAVQQRRGEKGSGPLDLGRAGALRRRLDGDVGRQRPAHRRPGRRRAQQRQ
jgi:hypothetical protein